ncbi:MAG: hypothetical protein Q8P77_03090 [Candidatus Veblenbacteria bacterium]|nr:hypothetical protein [Candidatus Veblenbacteria bacterium]
MPEFIPRAPEQPAPPAPERTPEVPERLPEKPEQPLEPLPSGGMVAVATPLASAPQMAATPSALQQQVEHVLEEDLEEFYRALNPAEQASFRALGETTAVRITDLLQQVKVKVSQVLALIRHWLLALPGLNQYFVEQEAKIKAAKLIKLHTPK